MSFTNLYGPTERTIANSYYTVPACPQDERTDIPIDRPCAGEELLVLDESLRPVSQGKVGALDIGGVGLSPGYWRDPAKTRTAFLQYPGPRSQGRGIDKRGDLARLGKTGSSITSVERTPQIKSRGYRIELGEIEAALHSLPSLRDCAVVAGPSQGFEGVAIPTWTFPTKRWCPSDSRRSTASPALSVSLRGKAVVPANQYRPN